MENLAPLKFQQEHSKLAIYNLHVAAADLQSYTCLRFSLRTDQLSLSNEI